MNWAWLVLAIGAEIASVAALKASDGLGRWPLVAAAMIAVALSYMALGLALRTIPMGVAYAVWAAAGIVATTAIGAWGFGQWPDPWTLLGIGFVLGGILILSTLAVARA